MYREGTQGIHRVGESLHAQPRQRLKPLYADCQAASRWLHTLYRTMDTRKDDQLSFVCRGQGLLSEPILLCGLLQYKYASRRVEMPSNPPVLLTDTSSATAQPLPRTEHITDKCTSVTNRMASQDRNSHLPQESLPLAEWRQAKPTYVTGDPMISGGDPALSPHVRAELSRAQHSLLSTTAQVRAREWLSSGPTGTLGGEEPISYGALCEQNREMARTIELLAELTEFQEVYIKGQEYFSRLSQISNTSGKSCDNTTNRSRLPISEDLAKELFEWYPVAAANTTTEDFIMLTDPEGDDQQKVTHGLELIGAKIATLRSHPALQSALGSDD